MQGERGVTPTSRMFAVIVIILLVALLISGCGQHKEPAPATAAEISAVAPNQPLTSTTPAPELARLYRVYFATQHLYGENLTNPV